jgi:uncharacterized repeat protein (TIGR03843 family)
MSAPGSTDSSAPEPGPTDPVELERRLATAHLDVRGRMPWSSNVTLLVELYEDEPESGHPPAEPLGRAVYKPHRGEQPLWDFPDGLYRREVAAYRLSRALGWDVVPPTVVRDGPFGPGSLQWFVPADFEQHYFTMLEDDALHDQLRRLCAFDLVANSTDRKGGHVLVDQQGHLWAIDNGLCLHAEVKLRTVIWDFAGEPLPADLADDLTRLVEQPLPSDLAALLDPFERDALQARARALLTEARFPHDPTGRRVPWPLV